MTTPATGRFARLRLYRFSVPMLSSFEHAGGARGLTDNVMCELTLDDGTVGFGEGVARSYVTGETTEISWGLLSKLGAALPREFQIASGDDALEVAKAWAESIPDAGKVVANATRCAIELAVIDALFRKLNSSPVPLLARRAGAGEPRAQPQLGYSLVAGKALLGNVPGLIALRNRYGYTAVKAKVGFGLEEDLANLERVREVFGMEADVRMDANRGMTWAQAAALLDGARKLKVRTIEDPLSGRELELMAPELVRLRAETGCEIVLDEPLRTKGEVEQAIALGAVDLVNVRISKCGGLLRSAEIAASCTRSQVAMQLGCQVGESAILSAAGRLFAQSVGNLRYLEGSNERLKFSPDQDLSEEDLTYGRDAVGRALTGAGLGIEVRRARLAHLSRDQLEVKL